MSTWRQDLADALTPIEGFNDASATLSFNIQCEPSTTNYGPLPQSNQTVISRAVQVKGAAYVDNRLVDGKNYVSGDFVTEIAYTKYLAARVPLASDPSIISGGSEKTLEEMRPMSKAYGIETGVDTLTIAGIVWTICRVDGSGIMNDEDTGIPVPSKLVFTLRR